MNSLAGYGSDDDENEQYDQQQPSVPSSSKRPDDDDYEAVNMDMSEDSQEESEPELPQAEPEPPIQPPREDRRDQDIRRNDDRGRNGDRDRGRDDRDRDRSDRGRPERDRNEERDRSRDDRDRRDDRYNRPDRSDRDRRPDRGGPPPKRGLLGDRPDQKETKIQSLLDVKPFGGEQPPSSGSSSSKSYDARDAVSPRFVDRDRERERDRERDRDRQSYRSDDRRGDRHRHERRSRSRDRSERSKSRSHAYPPPDMHPSSSSDRRASPPAHGEFRPSYKVNKKLEVMEKMGLQIKTPDGSMATAQQLRQAACESGPATTSQQLPSYYNPTAVNANKILSQVQKRKLLWSNKKVEAPEEAAKWTGTRFAEDNDGKQTNKFMRLMGIKDPAAVVKPEVPTADPIKKQEELFQAMQAQYEVARATTHTMRGVGLGFQRGPI